MTFANWLKSKNACTEGFKAHKHHTTTQDFWDKCERPDWMMWVAARKTDVAGWPDSVASIRIAIMSARRCLHLVTPGEERPRLAIEAAEAYLKDPSEANKNAAYAAANAANAAYAAYAAANAANAAYAAANAAYAAYAAANAANAANAAYAAANAAYAAYAAAYALKEERRLICDEIRKIWPKVGE